MSTSHNDKVFILRSYINSFWYLYNDALYFHEKAKSEEMEGKFDVVRLSRTALLLYILSTEGLINRALERFLPEQARDIILEREAKFKLEDKWLLLPLFISRNTDTGFDKSSYPWSHFTELITIRNEFVHPKHKRAGYYQAISSHTWKPLSWQEIPQDLHVSEKKMVFRQNRIPKYPYVIRPEHVDTVKKVVDDMIEELNI